MTLHSYPSAFAATSHTCIQKEDSSHLPPALAVSLLLIPVSLVLSRSVVLNVRMDGKINDPRGSQGVEDGSTAISPSLADWILARLVQNAQVLMRQGAANKFLPQAITAT